jgi:hypothetical protein
MHEDRMETPAEENERLKAELADAKKALTAAKAAKALQDENDRLSIELAAIRAEAAKLTTDPRIDILCALGFPPTDAAGLIPLLTVQPTTVLALDSLGHFAIHNGNSLSATLLHLQATVRKV